MKFDILIALTMSLICCVRGLEQEVKYICSWHGAGHAKKIDIVSIDRDANSKYPIHSLSGLDSKDKVCDHAYKNGTTVSIEVEDSTAVAKEGCGVTKTGKNYTFTFHTTSCGGECITSYDKVYVIECSFDEPTTTRKFTTKGKDIKFDKAERGDTKTHTEKVDLMVLKQDGTALDASTALGTEIIVRGVLFLEDNFATGVRIETCKVENTAGDKNISFIENGCTSAEKIFPREKGFKYTDIGKPKEYAIDSPVFPAFLFNDNTNTVVVKCTAKFCYDNKNENCAKACKNEQTSRRRKRSASEEKEQNLIVVLRISSDNSTNVFAKPPEKRDAMSDCSNRSYLIGLIILGCVLVLTFIVSIGMFVILKRSSRQSNDCEKTGYVNKGAH